MAYLGNSPLNRLYSSQAIALTQGQTAVNVSYTPGLCLVFKNGVLLDPGVDYTATDGSVITLSNAASAGDVLRLINLAQFAIANAIPLADADAYMKKVTALPDHDIGPVHLIGEGEKWWVNTAFYTGYRSPLCGNISHDVTATSRAGRIDAQGGLFLKADYAGLWGFVQEEGLIVPSASWIPGSGFYVDVDATHFRVPDLRNMFLRFSGTDADTANPRLPASYQADAYRVHQHDLPTSTGTAGGTAVLDDSLWTATTSNNQVVIAGTTLFTQTGLSGGSETRGLNTAVAAVILI